VKQLKNPVTYSATVFLGKSTTSGQRITVLEKIGQNIRDTVHKAVVVLVLAL
jgi:hypothetical protein